MADTVVGVYDRYSDAKQALDELTANGFTKERVTLDPSEETPTARNTLLRGDNDSGGIMGFFRSLFGMDNEQESYAGTYSEAVRRGSYLLTVHLQNDEQADLATEIMNRHDPVDIDERSTQWRSEGWQQYDPSAAAYTDAEIQQERSRYTKGSGTEKAAIPVIQEEMQVGKRAVQSGSVRIHQRVIDTPVEESVHLRDERVSVERRPVDEPATTADLAGLKDETIELRETTEEPVVAKVARVVEEVVVGKEVSERTETVSDTVRRSDVEVERMGGGTQVDTTRTGAAFDDSDFRSHWQSMYGQAGGSYDEYAPAYQHGSRLAADERYSKHQWSDVEPDVRREWETGHAGHPWEKFKDAVRYGWDKITK